MTTPPPATVLDVRTMPSGQRHPTIFATFASLAAGQALEVIAGHDPLPLRHQFEGEYAGAFSWEYLERGPEAWRVRIGRR